MRGQGMALGFLADVIAQMSSVESFTRLELNVYSFNQPAIRLYERLGFETEEVKPAGAVSGERNWDVMRMVRDLR